MNHEPCVHRWPHPGGYVTACEHCATEAALRAELDALRAEATRLKQAADRECLACWAWRETGKNSRFIHSCKASQDVIDALIAAADHCHTLATDLTPDVPNELRPKGRTGTPEDYADSFQCGMRRAASELEELLRKAARCHPTAYRKPEPT